MCVKPLGNTLAMTPQEAVKKIKLFVKAEASGA